MNGAEGMGMADKEKFTEEEALGYTIYIIAKNFQVTEPMRQYVWEKLAKVEKLHTHIYKIHVTLEMQRLEHVVTIVAHFDHFFMKVSADSTDMYASIDKAIDRLQKQFRKWKSRIHDYHLKPLKDVDSIVNVIRRPYNEIEEINAEIEAENHKEQVAQVIATEKRRLKNLNTDEALMKIELSGDPFLVYRDEKDKKLKVIYRREDGHYEIIQTE